MGPTGLCGGGWKEEGEYWERGDERQHDQMQSCCLSAGHEPTMSSDMFMPTCTQSRLDKSSAV